jgi:uncharacterized membrane protein YfcA
MVTLPAPLESLSLVQLILAALVIFAGATLQGSVGFGIGLIASPLLALIDPGLVPGPILLTGSLLSLLVWIRERHAMDVAGLKWGLVGRLVGTAVAALVLASIPRTEMSVLLGALILLAVLLSISGLSLRPTLWALLGAGTLSGFMSTTASAGGPPLALLYQRASGDRLRSMMSGYLFIGTVISIGALIVVGQFGRFEVLAALAMLPGMLAGYWISRRTVGLLDRGYTRTAVLAISAASSIAVILRAVL